MQASQIPAKFPVPFAASATSSYTRQVPQTTGDPTAASLQLGYPPETFDAIGSGGVAPDGRDMNGILNQITAWNQWQQAGGTVPYDATFSGEIGGYPAGALLRAANFNGFWYNTLDNNTSDPDTGGAGWLAFNVNATQRITLDQDLTFYISASGNDTTGNGTEGNPWATVEKVYYFVQSTYDINGFTITVQLLSDFSNFVCTLFGGLVGQTSATQFVIQGDVGNRTIQVSGPVSGTNYLFQAQSGAEFAVQWMTMQPTANLVSGCLIVSEGVIGYGNVTFNAVGSNSFVDVNSTLSYTFVTGPWTITGGPVNIVAVAEDYGTNFIGGAELTLEATPSWDDAFCQGDIGGLIEATDFSFSGSANGKRFNFTGNGLGDSGTGLQPPDYFPGSEAGTTNTGGQYF